MNDEDQLKGIRYVKPQDFGQVLKSSKQNNGRCCKVCLKEIRSKRRLNKKIVAKKIV
jgi:hypothetical protein